MAAAAHVPLRLLLAVHLLAAHATPCAPAAPPPPRWAGGCAGQCRCECRAPGGLGAVVRGALGALGGLYAHSPLRGGRRDETPRSHARSQGRGAADREPVPAGAPSGSVAKRGAQPTQPAQPPAPAADIGELACAVESPHLFGAGRMKKWRGRCTDARDLLAQLMLHFGLPAGGTAGPPGAGELHLQFYDRECEEYIDLEDCSWGDFVAQVPARAAPSSSLPAVCARACTDAHAAVRPHACRPPSRSASCAASQRTAKARVGKRGTEGGGGLLGRRRKTTQRRESRRQGSLDAPDGPCELAGKRLPHTQSLPSTRTFAGRGGRQSSRRRRRRERMRRR